LAELRTRSRPAPPLVAVEVRPPNDSMLGTLQVGGIDLQQSAVKDFTLLAPLAGDPAPSVSRTVRALLARSAPRASA